MNAQSVIVPTAYFGNVIWFKNILNHENIIIEHFEYFEKQSLRNSCEIYGANGKLKLSVPIKERKNKSLTNDILIDNSQHWQTRHIRSIESAYRNSPFFEYYWDDYLKILNTSHEKLIDLNKSLFIITLRVLKINPSVTYSTHYIELAEAADRRSKHHFNKSELESLEFKKYHQVFNEKCGFISNLWIGDVIFNLANDTISIIK